MQTTTAVVVAMVVVIEGVTAMRSGHSSQRALHGTTYYHIMQLSSLLLQDF